MALLNNRYIFVEDESVTHDVESSTHPIESGGEITDHVQRKPVTISIKGKLVNITAKDTDTGKEVVQYYAHDTLSFILSLQNSGSLVTYVGRNIASNFQIQSFNTSHPNTNWGGCDFDMTLKEVKIAQNSYKDKEYSKKNTSTQQVDKGENQNVYHTVKKGDCVWNLVTKTYKSLEPKYSKIMDKCNWLMSKNPDAFSRKGDFTTLQIGKKILVGYRK